LRSVVHAAVQHGSLPVLDTLCLALDLKSADAAKENKQSGERKAAAGDAKVSRASA
jgi:hypothetical protein